MLNLSAKLYHTWYNLNVGGDWSSKQELTLFKVDDRVKVLTPDGYHYGTVAHVLPEWYWAKCQYKVEFDELGRHEFPVDSGLKAVE